MDEEDYTYHQNKLSNKTYISRGLSSKDEPGRRLRIASKVVDSPASHSFAIERGKQIIRVTHGGRQEIIAKFYEDDRKVFVLTIQRFTKATGLPHRQYFSFVGEEIPKLLQFISNLCLVQFPDEKRINITDSELRKLLLSPEQVRTLVAENQSIVLELARSEVTQSDIIALGYRRKQLQYFHNLLFDPNFFQKQKMSTGQADEGLWQSFFEANPWIFGHGLSYLFLSNLDNRKLEQIVAGNNFTGKGKRADAVMKTKGAIEALCFVEIKKHTTELVRSAEYRPGCWAPSAELSGGVVQIQGTVEKAIRQLTEKIEPTRENGEPTGELLFNYGPRSFLVIGSLKQFETEHGVNSEKYRSFELFRRHTLRPEIITFDELYYRAKFIVDDKAQSSPTE